MKKLLIVTMISVLFLPLLMFAQTYTLYDSDNSSLPYNQVYCIDFDLDGNIWFGGQRNPATGLANVSRLASDLSGWTVYNQADLGLTSLEDRVFYIAVDDQNTKWFCTHYGVSYLKADGTAAPLDFTVDAYTRSVQTDSYGNVYISDRDAAAIFVSEDHGATWFQWNVDTLQLSGGRPEAYDLRNDSQGQLWICTWYGVSYRDVAGTWHTIADLDQAYTYAMAIDSQDNKWIVMHIYDGGDAPDRLVKLDAANQMTSIDSTQIPAFSEIIWDVEVDKNDHVWCTTGGAGLIEILPDGSYNQYDSTSTGGLIPEDYMYTLEIDDNDNIWIALDTEGVLQISGLIPTAIAGGGITAAQSYTLHPNYPNPFNPATQIQFDLQKAGRVKLAVYDVLGHQVKVLAAGDYPAGSHQAVWDGTNRHGANVASGVYIYRLESEGYTASGKMMLMR